MAIHAKNQTGYLVCIVHVIGGGMGLFNCGDLDNIDVFHIETLE